MGNPAKRDEVEATLWRVRRKMKAWGITVSYLSRHLGVSRQYGWQVVNHRTIVSPERATRLDRDLDSLIEARRTERTFGQRLRAVRLAAGLTLKDVADRIGYSWVGVERWEKDVCLPKPGVLWHLLSLYGVEPSSFMGAQPQVRIAGNYQRGGHGSARLPHGAREDLVSTLRAMGAFPTLLRQVSNTVGSSSAEPTSHRNALKIPLAE
jgi:transcriptional regulator with XRE-family HTH domain